MLLSEKKNHKNEHLEDIHIHSRVPYSFFGENIKSQIFITGSFMTEMLERFQSTIFFS